MTITPSESEIRAFVGSNSKYYLKKFLPSATGKISISNFNLGALFFGILWLPYRKIWKVAYMFYGIIVVEMILEMIIFQGILHREVPVVWDRISGIIPAVICGQFGNRWYYSQMCNVISELRPDEYPDESYLKKLSERGGTNLAASFGLFILFIIVIVGVAMLVSLLTGSLQ